MKVTIKQPALAKLAKDVCGLSDQKHPLFEGVLISASVGNLTLCARGYVAERVAEHLDDVVLEEGAALVNAVRFNKVVQALDKTKDVTLEIKDGALQVRSGRSRFKLQLITNEYKPLLKKGELHTQVFIGDMLDKVKHAVAKHDVRYFLNGFNVDVDHEAQTVSLVATDGHRISVVTESLASPVEQSGSYIVPRDLLAHIGQAVAFNDQDQVVSGGVTAQLVGGKFPDWRRVMPTHGDINIEVGKDDLLGAINRVQTVNEDASNRLIITFQRDKITLSNDKATEDIDASMHKLNGGDFKAWFNSAYIVDVLNTLDDDKVAISFTSETSAMLIEEGNARHVVMPMRL